MRHIRNRSRRAHSAHLESPARKSEDHKGRTAGDPKPESAPRGPQENFESELYDESPVAFYTLDRQGRISELNDRGAALLAFPSVWLLGRAFVVFVARHDVH